jgi:hypothetical protein
VPQVFAQGLELAGAPGEAKQFYSEVLAHRPDHFDALQMLSVIKLARGKPKPGLISEAMRLRKASLANPGQPRNDPARVRTQREALASCGQD